jgi:hypothetical protein
MYKYVNILVTALLTTAQWKLAVKYNCAIKYKILNICSN